VSNFPQTTLTLDAFDEGTDNPSQARGQLHELGQAVVDIINSYNQANGICPLNASGTIDLTKILRNQANGVVGLDENYKLNATQIPIGAGLAVGVGGDLKINRGVESAANKFEAVGDNSFITAIYFDENWLPVRFATGSAQTTSESAYTGWYTLAIAAQNAVPSDGIYVSSETRQVQNGTRQDCVEVSSGKTTVVECTTVPTYETQYRALYLVGS